MIMRRSYVVALLFLAGFTALAQKFTGATPAEAGFSAARLEHVKQVLAEDASKGLVPGSVLLVVRHGKVAFFDSVGILDPGTKAPMTKDAIFRVYSMSKAITSVSAMTLVEEGKIALSDPVSKYIPALGKLKVGMEGAAPKRPITIQDLLRHTSGFTYGIFGSSPVKHAYMEAGMLKGDFTNEEFAERISKMPLAYQPGTTWEYSHSTDVLGRVVEVVSGMTLYQYEKKRVFDVLGMPDTGYYVTDSAKHSRIAEPFPNDRTIGIDTAIGDPRVAGKWESGGGGVVSTAADYGRFLQMLLSGGASNGKRILSPKTVSYMTSDQLGEDIVPGPGYLPGPGYGFGLGFAVRRTAGVAPNEGSVGDYWWNGVAGTQFWVDPKEDMFVVFMIQSPRELRHYMSVMRNMIYGSLEK